MLWDEQVILMSGAGYNDNVLLSAFHPRGSAYFANGVEALAQRVPLDGWQIVGSVIGSDTRYWRNVGASSEDSLLGSLRVERSLPAGWKAGLEARGIYENQVLDISTSLGAPATALVKGFGVTAQPSLRKDWDAGRWLKLELPVTRWNFQTPLDNYWEYGPVLTAGWDASHRTQFTLSYGATLAPHDQWLALSASYMPLPQKLTTLQHRAELAWHQYWDVRKRWRSGTRLVFAAKRDNGGGWFDYNQYQIIEDLRWQTADWQVSGSAQWAYEDYPVQGVGILNGQTLHRELLNLTLDAERRLFKGLKCFAKLEFQRANSNEAAQAGDYSGTSAGGGLRYEF